MFSGKNILHYYISLFVPCIVALSGCSSTFKFHAFQDSGAVGQRRRRHQLTNWAWRRPAQSVQSFMAYFISGG